MSESELNDLEDLIRQSAEFPTISRSVRCRMLRVAGQARTEEIQNRRLPWILLACVLLVMGVTYNLHRALLFAVTPRPRADHAAVQEFSLGNSRLPPGANEWKQVDDSLASRETQLQRLLHAFWE
jgi:hypothetical protein